MEAPPSLPPRKPGASPVVHVVGGVSQLTTLVVWSQAILYSKITELDKQLGDNVWLWQSVVGYGVPAYASNVHNVYWNPILYGYNYSAIYIYPYS